MQNDFRYRLADIENLLLENESVPEVWRQHRDIGPPIRTEVEVP